MYDYRMVFVYPLSTPLEDLSELEESALNHLEKSISKTLDDGWEYVSTTTYSENQVASKASSERGVKAFVYRRFRKSEPQSKPARVAEPPLPKPAVIVPPVQAPINEEDPALTRSAAPKDEKHTTLLTLALLNALRAHADIEPETVLPQLQQQGEISEKQRRVLSRHLKVKRSAANIADITPPGFEKQVFQVSLMPFTDRDAEYQSYITELAAFLDLDEAFVLRELSARAV